jgi:hypothetical protein
LICITNDGPIFDTIFPAVERLRVFSRVVKTIFPAVELVETTGMNKNQAITSW